MHKAEFLFHHARASLSRTLILERAIVTEAQSNGRGGKGRGDALAIVAVITIVAIITVVIIAVVVVTAVAGRSIAAPDRPIRWKAATLTYLAVRTRTDAGRSRRCPLACAAWNRVYRDGSS
jgi:hypothetical protein